MKKFRVWDSSKSSLKTFPQRNLNTQKILLKNSVKYL